MVPETIRLKFQKIGSLQFISHLDLLRTMNKVLKRAGIPLWYSEGFNPHPKLVFALTVSVGAESVCELLDIRVTEHLDPDETMERLNRELTEELKVLEVYYPVSKFSEICSASYRFSFDRDISGAETIFQSPRIVTKNGKSGTTQMDISPLVFKWTTNGNTAEALLSAEPQAYLNPEFAAKIVAEQYGVTDYSILRTAMFGADRKVPFR